MGGYVVGDRGLPGLYKRYVYTDYCDGQLRSLVPHLGRAGGDRKLGVSVQEPGSFGVDDQRPRLHHSLAGPVYRLVPRYAERRRRRVLELADQPMATKGAVRWRAARRRRAQRRSARPTALRTRPRRIPNGSTSSTRPTARSSARSRSTRRRESPRPWTECAPTRPAGRRSATRAATTGSASCGTGCWITRSEIADTMQAETGKVRGDTASELIYLADLINFYGTKADGFIGDESVRAALAVDGVEKAPSPVPPLPGGRRDQPLELPAGDLPRRLAPRAAGRRRGGGQAVRVHPARTDRDRQSLEGGDRGSRCLRLRARRRRGRPAADRRRRLRPVHRLRPHGAQGHGPRRGDADPGQPRARRQGSDDRPLRRRPRSRRERRNLGRRCSTPARSASRSSGSTSRSPPTTSSSTS